ncbi:hypothetical protein BMS3Bbin02_00745 [bacterium BMS3Bbin02]|nr:hypothetical protein BMS3Bbin02_00745 [bacterium BMS3Bbin02]
MCHSDRHVHHACLGGFGQECVEQCNGGFTTLKTEPFGTQEFRMEESLERLGLVQFLKNPQLLITGRTRLFAFQMVLYPDLLCRFMNVHVFDSGSATVRVSEQTKDVSELHVCTVRKPAGSEVAIKIPNSEAVREGVELGVNVRWFLAQGVEVCNEVTAAAVHVDELEDLCLFFSPLARAGRRTRIHCPARRHVRDPHRLEDLVVEVFGTQQELVDMSEQHPGVGPLDDPVVICRGHGECPPNSRASKIVGVRSLEFRCVANAPHADDDTLSRHQTWHRLLCPDCARVRECRGCAGEVIDRDLV